MRGTTNKKTHYNPLHRAAKVSFPKQKQIVWLLVTLRINPKSLKPYLRPIASLTPNCSCAFYCIRLQCHRKCPLREGTLLDEPESRSMTPNSQLTPFKLAEKMWQTFVREISLTYNSSTMSLTSNKPFQKEPICTAD